MHMSRISEEDRGSDTRKAELALPQTGATAQTSAGFNGGYTPQAAAQVTAQARGLAVGADC